MAVISKGVVLTVVVIIVGIVLALGVILRPEWQWVLVISITTVVGLLVYLICNWEWVDGENRPAVIGGVTALTIAAFTHLYSNHELSVRATEETHRLNKLGVYKEFGALARDTNKIIQAMKDNTHVLGQAKTAGKCGRADHRCRLRKHVWPEYADFGTGLVLWASPEVIIAWNSFREAVGQDGEMESPEDLARRLDRILIAMRDDLSLPTADLDQGALLQALLDRRTILPVPESNAAISIEQLEERHSDLFKDARTPFPKGHQTIKLGMPYLKAREYLPEPAGIQRHVDLVIRPGSELFTLARYQFDADGKIGKICKVTFFGGGVVVRNLATTAFGFPADVSRSGLMKDVTWKIDKFSVNWNYGGGASLYTITSEDHPCVYAPEKAKAPL